MLEGYPDVLYPKDVQEILGIGKNLLYILLGSGKLQGFRVGRHWRITRESVDNYMHTYWTKYLV